MAKVGITYCADYGILNLARAISDACSVCDFPNVSGKRILLKPNILSDSKVEECITTNPEFLRAVIRILKEKGASAIYVGDSPGLQSSSFCGKNCGIYEVCHQEGVIWVDFTASTDINRISGTNQKIPLTHCIKEVDMIFSICKFKTHQLMYTTGAVKNLFGTVPGLRKSSCHMTNPTRESFAKLIVGIHETVKPSFSIMDAVVGMEGPGPANGYPRSVNLVLASENAFALDTAQALIMGYDVNDIPILNEAKRRKIYPDEITYPLLNAQDLIIKDYKRIPISKKQHFFKKLILPYFTRNIQKKKQKREPHPEFNPEKCIKCLKCVNICPAKILYYDREEGIINGNFNECIRCYCCHEMCPADAITIKKEGQP